MLPRAPALAFAAGATLAVVVLGVLWRFRRSRGGIASPDLLAAVQRIADPLGDAVVAFDPAGRLVYANVAALALAGGDPARMAARGHLALGADLAALVSTRGRSVATARVAIVTPVGPVPARAAAVRVPGRAKLDLVVFRVDPPPAVSLGEAPAARYEGRGPTTAIPLAEAAAGIARELREPLARASARASMLRLQASSGGRGLDPHLSAIESDLARAGRMLGLLADGVPRRCTAHRLDLGTAVEEVVSALQLPARVRVRRSIPPAPVLADPDQLRQALHHLVHAAAATMPAGGELSLSAERCGADWILEIADRGARPAPAIETSLAHALVDAIGGRLEIHAIRGRGRRCRLSLRAAPPGSAV